MDTTFCGFLDKNTSLKEKTKGEEKEKFKPQFTKDIMKFTKVRENNI